MIDGNIDTVAFQMNEIYQAIKGDNQDQYLRIDVAQEDRENYSSDMADASPENIQNLLAAGKKTLKSAIENGLDGFLDRLQDE